MTTTETSDELLKIEHLLRLTQQRLDQAIARRQQAELEEGRIRVQLNKIEIAKHRVLTGQQL